MIVYVHQRYVQMTLSRFGLLLPVYGPKPRPRKNGFVLTSTQINQYINTLYKMVNKELSNIRGLYTSIFTKYNLENIEIDYWTSGNGVAIYINCDSGATLKVSIYESVVDYKNLMYDTPYSNIQPIIECVKQWISLVIQHEKKKLVQVFKEELMMKCWNSQRVERMLETGGWDLLDEVY